MLHSTLKVSLWSYALKKIYDTNCPFPITQQQRFFLSSSTHSSSSQSDPWIRWSLHSTGMSSGRLFSGGASSGESACASISQSWGLPALEADARPAPPALPPALGHAWVSLCEAGGKKKRKSPHHTYSKLLSSTVKPICFSNYCRKKNGMPPDLSMTDNINCQTALCILMNWWSCPPFLQIINPLVTLWHSLGELTSSEWTLLPGAAAADSRAGGSLWQPAVTESQHPEARTHRSQRSHGTHHLRERGLYKNLLLREDGRGVDNFEVHQKRSWARGEKNKIISALTRLLTSFSSAPPSVELGSIFFAERKGAS